MIKHEKFNLINHTKDEHIYIYEKNFDKKEDTMSNTVYKTVQVSKPPFDIFPSISSLQCHQ